MHAIQRCEQCYMLILIYYLRFQLNQNNPPTALRRDTRS